MNQLTTGISWLRDYDTALEQAHVQKKHLLIYFSKPN